MVDNIKDTINIIDYYIMVYYKEGVASLCWRFS